MKKSFLLLLFSLTTISLLMGNEIKSTAHFPVGELGSKWKFGSDHLPVGITVNGHHFASWNILNVACLRWIERNEQGLKDSAIIKDNSTVNGAHGLTIREAKIVCQILKMLSHPTQSRSLIALEETGSLLYKTLLKVLPKNIVPVTTRPNELINGDIFLYDANLFEFIDLKSGRFTNSYYTWMLLTLREINSQTEYVFVHSHVPDNDSQLFRNELAQTIVNNFNSNAITIIMGDQNRSADFFLADLARASEALNWHAQPFKKVNIPYPTHINTQQEACWVDNIFLYAPPQLPCVATVAKGADDFFEELAVPIQVMWECFLKQPHIKKARAQLAEKTNQSSPVLTLFDTLASKWRYYTLEQQGNYPIDSLLDAVVEAANHHAGQLRGEAENNHYIMHPLAVCHHLWHEGKIRNPNILMAALVHDTMEKSHAAFESITATLGERIAKTVQEVSQISPLEFAKDVSQMSHDAKLVKLADQLAEARDLNAFPDCWDEQEADSHRQRSKKLLEQLRGTNRGLEQALEREWQN